MSTKIQVIITALAMILGGVIGGPIMEKYLDQHGENENIKLKNKVKELEVKVFQLQTENSRLKNENVGLKTKVESLENQPQQKMLEVSAELSRLRAENAILKQRGKGLEGYRQPMQAIIVERNNLVFTLKECKYSGGLVTCSFMVTNKSTDFVKTKIYGYYSNAYSSLYDDLGNEYYPRSVTFGYKSSRNSVTKELPPNVPIKFVLTFEKVSPEAKLVKSIVVLVKIGRGRSEKLTFNNVPLTKN